MAKRGVCRTGWVASRGGSPAERDATPLDDPPLGRGGWGHPRGILCVPGPPAVSPRTATGLVATVTPRLSPRTGVVPFVALLLLQRRPVAGRALLVSGSGCPGHGLCRNNVQEQTRRQVALLNATAQDLFSLYVSGARGRPGPPRPLAPSGA